MLAEIKRIGVGKWAAGSASLALALYLWCAVYPIILEGASNALRGL